MTKLRTAEQKFSDGLEAAPDAMVVLNRAGDILIVNSQTERLFGYAKAEMIGQKFDLLVPGRHSPHPLRNDQLFAAQDVARADVWGRRKNGEDFCVEITHSDVETSEGMLVSTAIRDITERKRCESALEDKNRELEAAVKELDAFCSRLSHDLRGPLRAMDGFSRILLKQSSSELDPEGRRYLQYIRDGAVQMGHLIDDLLKFSRLGKAALTKQVVPTADLVEHIIHDAQKLAPERIVSVTVGKLPDLWGDPVMLKQVFANLIANAFKYTRSRSNAKIEIGMRDIDGERVLFVRDNGVGFDMQYAGKLFGVFQRLHRSEDYEGTGVGLAIVQRSLHRHGLRVWAEAELDKGATFFFTTEAMPHAQ